MELKEGEKNYNLVHSAIKKAGFCTYRELLGYLGIPYGSREILNQHMKALGIVLGPFVRNERYYKRVYTRYKRPFTEAEAKSLIARHRALEGRRLDDE